MFLWTDLETTGLDPNRDLPLAIGIIITNDAFTELTRREWVIGWPAMTPALLDMDQFVLNMHTKNNLLAQVLAPFTPPLAQVQKEICAWLTSRLGPTVADIKARPPYAGNTVHFDKAFIERHLPDVSRFYNYRCLDVSTLKVLALATIPGARAWEDARPDGVHTPLRDLEGSLLELEHWRKELKK